jgi:hypothetical protein
LGIWNWFPFGQVAEGCGNWRRLFGWINVFISRNIVKLPQVEISSGYFFRDLI